MEQNVPVIAKKIWNIVRVVFFMVRKGLSKRKLMLELDLMMKRGKLAGKAIGNLLSHHHHHHGGGSSFSYSSAGARRSHDGRISFSGVAREYEFSCSNSPAPFSFPFYSAKRRRSHSHNSHSHFFSCAHAPPAADDDDDHFATVNAVKMALEILNSADQAAALEASPILPDMGFRSGQSPSVRLLRITDSPFLMGDAADGDSHVDEAAEAFIERFYNNLKQQKNMDIMASPY